MVGSPLAAFTNSTERLIARKSYIDYCTIVETDKDSTDGIKCHSPDHPEYYNTVSLKIRSTKLNNTDPNAIQHVNALVLQTFVGNCFGEPYTPRVGDLVAVLFMYNEKPLVLGPVATIQQPPVMRAPTSDDAKYDYVNKWCQWLRPEKDKNYDYFDHPQGKKPICFKRFHGPVTGEVGCGRDEMTIWDCQKGDADPTCSDCCNIDSVPRSGEQWHKIYSTQTESEEAYNSRMELHARCGSYFRVESDNTNEASSSSSEYSEEIGHIRLGNALSETDKRFHLNIQGNRYGDNGVGSFDLHTNHEEVQIASESTGVRFAAIRPEDSQVTWAYELMNFPTTSFIRCYKDGIIEINSLDGDSSITVDGTANKVTVDGTVNVELIASSEVTCTTPLTHVTGNMQIDGSCTHGSCSCDNAAAASGCDVAVALEDNIIKIVDKEGTVIEEGVLGVDDTACLQAGIDACPQNGKMFICPGTFTLEADKLFYLNGSGPETAANPFYYCLGVLDGKNIALEGSGVGSTILKLAPGQHYENHHAVMILNRAHWWDDGATMFVVSDMTIDGNRDEQDEWYHDGPGLFLTGSLASNFRFQRLWLKDSFGYGIYCGNNGSGPINGLVINDIRATNCYKTAIMTDTVCGLLINNCIIEDSNCGIECVGNQPDYLTRHRDAIVISDVICRRAGITLWTVNDVNMNGVYMDCTGAPLQYGLLIHSAIRVNVSNSRFINNTNYKYSTFIDANTYMEDGPCEVFLNNSDFEGSYAFRILGEAECDMHNGRISGYRSCVYMIGEYMSPVACKLRMHGVDVLALQPIGEDPEPTLLVDIAEGGDVLFNRCNASKAGYFQVASGGKYFARDCMGAGLEGHNSRWRKEEGTYVATPASTSTITTFIDRTAAISIGTPVRYEISGVVYYGLVMNVTTTTITIAGPPLSDDIDDLYFGVSEMVIQMDHDIPGAFAAGAEGELIKTIRKSHSVWRGKPAYLVQIGHIVQTLDSTDQPEVTASINGSVIGTDNTNVGLPVALVLQSTTVGINPSNYRIEYGDVIELETTAGGTGDASDLTAMLTFVSES